jgi:tetratricopeptide (TPR) repeat protein
MMHGWWVNRVALAAAGSALTAVTPVTLAAAGVRDPWLLAAATSAAAILVLFSFVAQDRYHRAGQRRGDEALRVQDGCLVLADGSLPRARDITDAVRLGAHEAALVEAEPGAPPGGASAAPAYIPRDLDAELREQLAAGGFVLLVGDSAAGKTRMAFEALRATLPDHTLIAPVNVDAVTAAMSHATDQRCCVLWLDDLERFLGPGGITAADIDRLLGDSGSHRVIMATLRAAEQARLAVATRDDDRTPQGLRDVREVLDRARQVQIARSFTTAELERAGSRGWDARIAEASRHGDSHGIAEYITAAPSLLRAWEDARSSSAGTHARGAAIVAAAIDLRRAGYIAPIPRDLLNETHERYLDDAKTSSTPPEPLAEAWAWATSQRRLTTGLLRPVGDNRIEVFDYLTDAVQRHADPLDLVPEPVVRTALTAADASDADSLARTAYSQGRWPLAADAWRLCCQLLASDPRRGKQHPDTLTSRGNLALVLHDLGRLEDAEAENRAVLTVRQQVLGPDHADSLTSRDCLALVLCDLGRLEEAETEIRAVLAARHRVLGRHHPSTLASRANLAAVLHERGQLDEAETETRAVLAARRRVLGRNHPSTLASRNNLALVLQDRGQLDEAETETRGVLAARKRALGPSHPDTLASRNNLALVLHDLGRLSEAEAEIRAAHAARQLVLGAHHPSSLVSRNNLARVLRDLGWLDEAEAEIRAVLAIRQRVLGPDHFSTLASRNSLAGVLHDRGRLDEAEAEIRAVLAVTLRVLGPDHPDTLASRNNLALVLRDQGRLDEAEPEFRAVRGSQQRLLGPDNASTGGDVLPSADADTASDLDTDPDGEGGARPDADADAEMIMH